MVELILFLYGAFLVMYLTYMIIVLIDILGKGNSKYMQSLLKMFWTGTWSLAIITLTAMLIWLIRLLY